MEMDEEWCLDYKGEMGSSRLGKGECVVYEMRCS